MKKLIITIFALFIISSDLCGAQRWGPGSRFYGPQIRPPRKKQIIIPESITTTEYGAPLSFKAHAGPYSKYGWHWQNNPHYGYSFWHGNCGWVYSNQRKKWWNTCTNKWYARPMWSKKYYVINY